MFRKASVHSSFSASEKIHSPAGVILDPARESAAALPIQNPALAAGFGKAICKFLPLLAMLLLCACGGEEPKEDAPRTATSATQARPTPSREELERAAALVSFANRARENLSRGYHSLPDFMAASASHYLDAWRLAPRPTTPRKDSAAFDPPAGLFNDAEAAALEKAYADMDKALNNVLAHYASLERYVADKNIRDDGEKGRLLGGKIADAHAQFLRARQSWLGIVDKRAAEAERLLLINHPLERQMNAALDILQQFGEVSDLLATEAPQKELLQACLANLRIFTQIGERPPFPAKPALERLYREFIKSVKLYMTALERVLQYGCHNAERHDINLALILCQKTYNEFAASANSAAF